jgi:flavodoxin I
MESNMSTIGLFYGTTAGTTEVSAEAIQSAFNQFQPDLVTLHNIGEIDLDDLYNYDKLIIGVPTYNIGELQDDWYLIYDDLELLTLTGVQVAMFGHGDQYGYPDTFQDALGILGRRFRDDCGADLVGFTSTDGYDFSYSDGVEDGKFMGLAIDDDFQAHLTEERILAWIKQLIHDFHLENLPAPIHK